MSTTVYTYSTTLTVTSCGVCGIGFAIPDDKERRCRESSDEWFWCPNGHKLHYSKSENKRLTAELEREKRWGQWERDQRIAAERDAKHQTRRAAAARGHLTRIKNRIANGVCPVPGCKRSGLGADVVAHIATCHPQYHLDAEST